MRKAIPALVLWCVPLVAFADGLKSSEWTFTTGESSISGMPDSHNEIRRPANWRALAPFMIPDARDEPLPAHFDWRDRGVVSAVKDQAQPVYCGSCWAFGTVASLESAIAIRTGQMPDLAEQQLVSCQPSYGTCSGGYFAYGFYQHRGANHETDFPYQATNAACNLNAAQHERVVNWAYLGQDGREPTTDEMKQAIRQYGPIAVTISASGAWSRYHSGVYNECNTNGTNHIVALVGWDDTDQAWILKNSHGTVWGEQGYMRIKYVGSTGAKCNNVGQEAAFVNF